MTTTTTTKTSNRPSHELFFVEERTVSPAVNLALGRAENAMNTVWHKAGIAFTTERGNINVYLGKRGEPGAKRLLITFSKYQEASESRRLPVADIFEKDANGNIDFKSDKVGVAFVNSDGSYTLVIGDRGDLEQLRYQLRPTAPAPRATPAAAEREVGSDNVELDEHNLRMEAIRSEEAAAAAEATKPVRVTETRKAPVSRAIRRVAAAA